MLKNFLIAAACVIASPALVFSQDFFLSFDDDSLITSDTQEPGTSGTAFIFSDGLFGFDAADLNITSTDSSVLLLTDGEVFNPPVGPFGVRFDNAFIEVDPVTNTGDLFAVNIVENGIRPLLSPLFDPLFFPEIGPNGAFLFAEINFDLIGPGIAGIELSLGPFGAIRLPTETLDPSFGSAVLTVGAFSAGTEGDGATSDVPEPSSVVLLILGSAGMLARRRKSL